MLHPMRTVISARYSTSSSVHAKKMDQKWAIHFLVRDSLVMSFNTHYRNQSHIYSVFNVGNGRLYSSPNRLICSTSW